MKRLFSLGLGFIVGLVFETIPLNCGLHGFVLEPIERLINFVGAIFVIVFGSILIYEAFKCIRNEDGGATK